MKKYLVLVILLIIATPLFAAYHLGVLEEGTRTLSYMALSQSPYAYNASALNYGFSIEKHKTAEFFVLGNRSLTVLSNDYNQAGLHINHRLLDFGWTNFAGVYGLGVLYNSTNGGAFSGNVGGILGFPALLKLSIPMVVSIFRDGGLLDYSGGITLAPGFLGGGEFLLGGKGTAMLYTSGGSMAFENSMYLMLGYRAYF